MSARALAMFVLLASLFLFAFLSRGQGTIRDGFPGVPVPLAEGERRPVLVELFTSEGCSSCPPADALLIRLEKEQPIDGAEIIALGFHVDYWNYIGWTDRFSSGEYSTRQQQYSRAFDSNQVYTPQMIVDGQAEFVGSDARRAASVIAQASFSRKARIGVTVVSSASSALSLSARVTDLPASAPGEKPELWLAVTETNLSSQASSGENSGRRLAHTAVVRELRRLTALDFGTERTVEFTIKPDSNWNRENLRAVVFVQERASRRILGAARIPLHGPTN